MRARRNGVGVGRLRRGDGKGGGRAKFVLGAAVAVVRRAGGCCSRAALVAGRDVLELGCGLGRSCAAALGGATAAVATDREPDAVAFAAQNAEANDVAVSTRAFEWSVEPEEAPACDVLPCADVLYGPGAPALLAPLLRDCVRPGGVALLADPRDRPYRAAYLEELLERDEVAGSFEVASRVREDVRLATKQGDEFCVELLELRRIR